MERLKTEYRGFTLYNAGLPDFPRNFTRDSIISSILSRNSKMLENQLNFCTYEQGANKNPKNGEEPGKIIHEYPAVDLNRVSTKFSACDTTALFLVGHKFYIDLTGDKSLADCQQKSMENAIKYILSHLNQDNLFMEDPKFCDGKKFATKTTYWKDSEIIDRKNGEPSYPICYLLAHVQNMCGMRCAAKILNSKYFRVAEKMKKGVEKLFNRESDNFYIAIDKKGPIEAVSSDFLHMLFYLEPGDLKNKQLEEIIESSKKIETVLGYRTLEPELLRKTKSEYHTKTVWPFEQAIINSGAMKHRLWAERCGFMSLAKSLRRVEEISSRVASKLDTDPEIFILGNPGIEKGGCDPQLWTIAAKKYFNKFKGHKFI
ncbi:MAG: hypothetical protein DRP06_03960 [Candidatus Aenigmatarchaeota archaeon]|nr:MAG: hypothetical protein DRP06_03960 [Candidatus Aenigmarchaeota archaeon]